MKLKREQRIEHTEPFRVCAKFQRKQELEKGENTTDLKYAGSRLYISNTSLCLGDCEKSISQLQLFLSMY